MLKVYFVCNSTFLLQMLNILAQYKLPSGLLGPLGIHRVIEALKHVAAIRTNLGDPNFYNVTEVLSNMLSPKFAQQLKKTINDNRTFDSSHYGGRLVLLHWWFITLLFLIFEFPFCFSITI